MRIRIDIPDDQWAELIILAGREEVSRASLIRQAISDLLIARREQTRAEARAAVAFGIRPDMEDGLAYQERLRSEW